jgi:CRP/FNR family cyclic AMP-dependent transcriptional regulator
MFIYVSEDTYQDGHVLLKEGTSGNWLYVVLSGAVEISKMIDGRKYVIDVLRPGEVFGEVGFIGGKKRTATATTIGQTVIGVVDRTSLDAEFNRLSSDFRAILLTMANRFEKMVHRVVEFSSRIDMRIQKTLSLTYKDDQAFISAYISNISTGGLFIKTEKPLRQGDQFLLRLQLPALQAPLKVSCEVAWVKGPTEATAKEPPGMGIKFVEMSKGDRDALKQYLGKITKG